jgi:peptidoglycan hydrolase CwlO-like protein
VEKDALESRLAGVHEELIGLKQMHVALEQEKSTLLGRHHELEQDLKALTCARDEQVKLAQERSKQINDLQQQIQSRQAGEVDLAARQQLMHEEMVRAEAQIDLIKDMLLREQGI